MDRCRKVRTWRSAASLAGQEEGRGARRGVNGCEGLRDDVLLLPACVRVSVCGCG